MNSDTMNGLITKAQGLGPEDLLKLLAATFPAGVVLASSLGEEDQVLTDMIARHAPGISVFTLDTGRLFSESYALLALTQKRYAGLHYDVYYPQTQAVEDMVREKGVNLFYESVENRKRCCHVRKVEPLRRALSGKRAWITGLRRDQSLTRTDNKTIEFDEANGLIKVNPLIDWSLDQVRAYIKEHQVDVSPLHAQGFISIGCQPCTRAVEPGQDIRAGRWWWEQPESKECGLHNNPKWKGRKG